LKLTQGLLPDSKVKDGPDNNVTTYPDDHGGYLFETWEMHHPWKMAGIKIGYNVRQGSECGFGVQRCHKFTIDECNKLVEYLKGYVPIEMKGMPVMKDPNNDEYGIFPEWHERLIELFSNTNDPPVFYFAN
jgi:hypothetical protein